MRAWRWLYGCVEERVVCVCGSVIVVGDCRKGWTKLVIIYMCSVVCGGGGRRGDGGGAFYIGVVEQTEGGDSIRMGWISVLGVGERERGCIISTTEEVVFLLLYDRTDVGEV